ncbi:hypothetical protein GDO78_022249 [Eleutherodactylus coqui]|uniref:Uncharacterized protein n=1 Tax=Eleutherodactylus coqui TaxID=57060 RepID=A0A8J6EGQ6_ELECQ|nr:hypothetical protein GDO78_022249 [Eleutherodactylus coqui]
MTPLNLLRPSRGLPVWTAGHMRCGSLPPCVEEGRWQDDHSLIIDFVPALESAVIGITFGFSGNWSPSNESPQMTPIAFL